MKKVTLELTSKEISVLKEMLASNQSVESMEILKQVEAYVPRGI